MTHEQAHIARIESNGMPHGTRIFLDDGRELIGATDVSWRVGMDDLASVSIDFFGPVSLMANEGGAA